MNGAAVELPPKKDTLAERILTKADVVHIPAPECDLAQLRGLPASMRLGEVTVGQAFPMFQQELASLRGWGITP